MRNFEVNQNELELLIKLVKNYQKEIEQIITDPDSDETTKIGNEANKVLKTKEVSDLLKKLENTMSKM
jgi:hypothetical protein